MEAVTLFYIFGGALTVMALVISFLGIRMESFPPSRPVLLAGTAVFVAVIGLTVVYAWEGAEEEQEHRNELIAAGEEPSPADVVAEYEEAARAAVEEARGAAPAEGAPPAAAADNPEEEGAAVYEVTGCGGCHALAAAGSTGAVGPDLDVSLKGQTLAYIEESILDPEAEIAEGFSGGVMPSNYGERLSPEQIDALVQYIADSVGVKG